MLWTDQVMWPKRLKWILSRLKVQRWNSSCYSRNTHSTTTSMGHSQTTVYPTWPNPVGSHTLVTSFEGCVSWLLEEDPMISEYSLKPMARPHWSATPQRDISVDSSPYPAGSQGCGVTHSWCHVPQQWPCGYSWPCVYLPSASYSFLDPLSTWLSFGDLTLLPRSITLLTHCW